MRAYCFLHCIVDILVGAPGKESATAYEQKFGVPCDAPVIPIGAKIRYNPITEDDKAKTHQMGEKLLDGIFVGYHQIAGGALACLCPDPGCQVGLVHEELQVISRDVVTEKTSRLSIDFIQFVNAN